MGTKHMTKKEKKSTAPKRGGATVLSALARRMLTVAANLEYYGGFSKAAAKHSRELAGAARVVAGWAKNIRAEERKRRKTA